MADIRHEERVFYAHSVDGRPEKEWQPLAEHLREVARLARQFAEQAKPNDLAFHETAWWAGLLHDLGKYRPEFQRLLRGGPRSEKTRHKMVGAALAAIHGRADAAFCIAGHHHGLPDFTILKDMIIGPGGQAVIEQVKDIAFKECPDLQKQPAIGHWGANPFMFDLYVRLLFSCLVDADWQDTDSFLRQAAGLPAEPDFAPLIPGERFLKVMNYIEQRSNQCRDSHIAALRKSVLQAALNAAGHTPGLFSMAVPTGGGKTLSALAFALRHAQCNNLRRIVYAAPYLTILEQNAREIRRALNAENDTDCVFEHHSLTEPVRGDDENEARAEAAARMAENWDAPVIITTNVQLFESLFSNRPGQCRKIHNITRSVIILDECQTLPPGLTAPSCDMLNGIASQFGCSVVLCTATQPAWSRRDMFPEGLEGIHEIIPPDWGLYERLRRVRIHWPKRNDPPIDWPSVADLMAERKAALCVVNTKTAARALFNALRQCGCDDALHLSTAMCPAHRLAVIDEVRRRLESGDNCRLVSTQLIEAGVDLDFPLVLREMAPLEAIVQAAGRCNREGLLNMPDGTPGGQVIVFHSIEGRLPPDLWYKAGIAKVEQDFLGMNHEPDIGNPQDIEEYFQRLYHSGELDQHHIQDHRANRKYAEVAKEYHLIEGVTEPVVVATWESRRDEINQLLDSIRYCKSRRLFHQLSRFQVNLRQDEIRRAEGRVMIEPSDVKVWWGVYDQNLGLVTDGDVSLSPV